MQKATDRLQIATDKIVSAMSGDEIIAALKGIVNSTALFSLDPEYKAPIRRLLQIIDISLCTNGQKGRNV